MVMATLIASLLLAAGPGGTGTAAGWWNADWSCRTRITVDSGFYKREDLLLSQDVDFAARLNKAGAEGNFDPASPRVAWVHGTAQEEVPSRFFPDKGGNAKGILVWKRPGIMEPMVRETFYVYFDTLRNPPKQAALYPLERPEANRILNPGFEEPDPKDPSRPAFWKCPPKIEGGRVEWVKGEGHSGDHCMKLICDREKSTDVSVSQDIKVSAGKRYLFSVWIKVLDCGAATDIPHMALMTAWFGAGNGQVPCPGGGTYGNYKAQPGLSLPAGGQSPWTRMATSDVNVYDPHLKVNMSLPDGKLARGTTTATVSVGNYGGKVTFLCDDVEVRELSEGEPPVVVVGAVEKRQ